jgi:hypothetical protein
VIGEMWVNGEGDGGVGVM